MSDRKRAFPVEADEDTPTKKARTGSNASQPSFKPSPGAGQPGGNTNANDLIAQKKAEIAAKLASFKNPNSGPQQQQKAPTASSSGGQTAPLNGPPPANSSGAASGSKPDVSAMSRKVAEARQRIQEMSAKQSNTSSANPYLNGGPGGSQSLAAAKAKALADQANDSKPGSAIHPLLMDTGSAPAASSSKDRYKPMLPKFASTKANARASQSLEASKKAQALDLDQKGPSLEEAKADPHFDRRLGVESLQPRQKRSRPMLQFNQKGKFIRMAESIRQEARMEALKARIAEAARKAGLEEDLEADGGLGRRIKKQPPPGVEWWDVGLVEGDSYESIHSDHGKKMAEHGCTDLVQHPIPIPAPGDKKDVTVRPLTLTKKERKKMRRIRRAEELRDHQDRVKMGLLPPDPPKVKLSNMMRVLTQEAVADPTKIEARVRREMNARQAGHEKMNAQRKLTDDQRREKVETKARAEEAKGLHAAAFRVKYLSNPSHKFKVRKNAEQLYLTGTCLYTPRFAMVLVEGSAASIKKYKKLMLRRIDWQEDAVPYAAADSNDYDAEADVPKDSNDQPINMAENECVMVWEGEHRDRMFTQFRPKSCPTDHLAREYLGPKAEGVYDFARKSMGIEVGM